MSEDTILLKLRRNYSKEEAVKFISDQLAQAQMEIGYLKSEVAELREENAKLFDDNGRIREYKKERKRERDKLIARIGEEVKQTAFWRDKYLELKAKSCPE